MFTTKITCSKPTRIHDKDEWGTPTVTWNGFCTRLRWHRGACIDRTQTTVVEPRSFRLPERTGMVVLAAVIGALLGLWLSPGRAYAEPYGGCDEAYLYPRSAGAADCRAEGWVIRQRVVVGPQGWVHHNALPACKYEDSRGCYWNAERRGNKMGRSFVNLVKHDGGVRVKFVVTRSLDR